jgi:hypothetical protein
VRRIGHIPPLVGIGFALIAWAAVVAIMVIQRLD